MARCPAGHESEASDYCDTCGLVIAAEPTGAPATPAPPLPAAGGTGPAVPPGGGTAASAAGAGVGGGGLGSGGVGSGVGAGGGISVGGGRCPVCQAERNGRFCEECGYDFELAEAMPEVTMTPGVPPLETGSQGTAGLDTGSAIGTGGSGGSGGVGVGAGGGGTGGVGGGAVGGSGSGGGNETGGSGTGGGGLDLDAELARAEAEAAQSSSAQSSSASTPLAPTTSTPDPAASPDPQPSTVESSTSEPSTAESSTPETSSAAESEFLPEPPETAAVSLASVLSPTSPLTAELTLVVNADRDYYKAQIERGDIIESEFPFPKYPHERRFTFTQSPVRIGRASASRGLAPEIDLTGPPLDPAVSHLHAQLIRHDEGWVVVDLGSANGTRLNDAEEPLEAETEIPVRRGDRVHLGVWTTITIQ